ncbi:hypothetical protein TY91_00830 [Secundilactobacillus collinoides]|uniref:Uncharacterized protein n=1 Tax=Secundilactobacillus collinoides TaxID=33960 RepID=A0A166HU60_SECCO|nr:hypothetical protein TY91_00830 [Secundilactobacillus collinoides]
MAADTPFALIAMVHSFCYNWCPARLYCVQTEADSHQAMVANAVVQTGQSVIVFLFMMFSLAFLKQ